MFFFFFLSFQSVQVYHTKYPPIIDGIIEDSWQFADSAYGFIQYLPYEREPSSEYTVVYLLQDANNLYVVFKCLTSKNKLTVNLGGNEDWVAVYLDPFGSKSVAYYFKVTVSGKYFDGLILDDGNTQDASWDGVWYFATRCYDNYFIIEIKIPFKSIRYNKNTSEWGINFKRFIAATQEVSYWTEVTEKEGFRVSKFGIAKDIHPESKGYYFEIYPEGILRYERGVTNDSIKPCGSLTLKWDLTSQSTFSATFFPDFAQIEADPYTLNLSRYPVRLSERRPFFVEGSEIFRSSGRDVLQPIEIFYSRAIGKSINGTPVPILGGIKLTNKSTNWNIGLLGAMTDSFQTEPQKNFGALRIVNKIYKNSEIGMLFSGMITNGENYNYAIGFDGIHRFGLNRIGLQGAVSDRNKKMGWALSSGGQIMFGNLLGRFFYNTYGDSFDVSEIGYAPWAGEKEVSLGLGPNLFFKNFIRTFYLGPFLALRKEPNETQWSKIFIFNINPNFHNNWGFSFNPGMCKMYEANLEYIQKSLDLFVWGNGTKYATNFGSSFYYSYNWHLNYLAYQASNWLWFEFYPLSRITPAIDANIWIEWDTLNTIAEITPKVTPRIEFQITKNMSCEFFNEFVWLIPEAGLIKNSLISSRFGFLFSFNFKPKSWLYIALNDYRKQGESSKKLELQNQIGVFKIKYLFYF
ncbi:MAG: DUF5916 domain-containing protein [candidate division WOR-3 bacterium]